jgi:hypothetical protein
VTAPPPHHLTAPPPYIEGGAVGTAGKMEKMKRIAA